ncbi:protein neprosin-like [Quercus suber]|uniref:protein neprosin-like n=1 Tax=Quercus suber TaxID=58331 RepID=UPI0032DF23F6
MKPNSIPSGPKENSYQAELSQNWHKNGQCPEGTVPIRQIQEDEWIPHRRTQLNHSFYDSSGREYAVVKLEGGEYYGARASLNVWSPFVSYGEFSLAQIWVASGPPGELNTVEAGWRVTSRENKTRLFTYWTSDGYQNEGCFNLECPGFVQVNQNFVLGSSLEPVSNATLSFDVGITIYKENGNWWLQVQDQVLGYWPGSIFTYLASNATKINWGGEVYNSEPNGNHTRTQMGSGHFGSKGRCGKASFFRNIGYTDNSGKFRDVEAQSLNTFATRPSCYNVKVANNTNGVFGTHFYFGGPGYSTQCAK